MFLLYKQETKKRLLTTCRDVTEEINEGVAYEPIKEKPHQDIIRNYSHETPSSSIAYRMSFMIAVIKKEWKIF